MKIIVCGIAGFMGREVVKAADKGYMGAEVVGGIDPFIKEPMLVPVAKSFDEAKRMFGAKYADCIIDFSHHSLTCDLLKYAITEELPVIIATTGHTEEELKFIDESAKKVPVFFSYNMSLGIALLLKLAKTAAAAMPDADIEIVETHHNRKLDAPSGTAIMIADEIKKVRKNAKTVVGRSGHGKRNPEDIGIQSVRLGNIVGIHEVIVGTGTQTITLKHEAYDRALFAEGSIVAADFLIDKKAGKYNMNDIVKD